MTYSANFIDAVVNQNTDEVFLFLITLSHDDLLNPIRVVNNVENINSRGMEFTAFPFDLILPQDDGDTLPQVIISLSNVDLSLVDEIRSLNSSLDVTLEIVLASNPSYVEMSIEGMKTISVQYDAQKIEATCQIEDVLNLVFPKDSYLPSNFPGLFQ